MDFLFCIISYLTTACLPLFLLYVCFTWNNSSNTIPGPKWCWPILGHLPMLGSKPHLALTQMQKKYGDIFKIRLGPHTAIVITGKEAIRNVCHLSSLVGRPHKFFNSWSKHNRYFAFGHSEACLQYRKAALKAIAAFTKDNLREAVEDVVEELVTTLCAENDGKSQSEKIRASAADVSYLMCFGENKKERNDVEFTQVMASLNHIFSFAKIAGIADLFPWALYLPFFSKQYQLYTEAQNKLLELVRQQEVRHRSAIDVSSGTEALRKPTDLCDLLSGSIAEDELQVLLMRFKELRRADAGIGSLSEQTGMLLVAGYETVAVSLTWAIILLATHPEAQENIWKELASSGSCHLLEAFILESLRFSMASPLAMPHMTLRSTTIGGMHIPHYTLVLVNLWSGSRDCRVWGPDADKFVPRRLIDESTGQVNSNLADQVLAFGSGRRRCVGEKLAKAEIQQLIVGIVTRCRISLADEKEVVDYWSNNSTSRNIPPIVNMKFVKRN